MAARSGYPGLVSVPRLGSWVQVMWSVGRRSPQRGLKKTGRP